MKMKTPLTILASAILLASSCFATTGEEAKSEYATKAELEALSQSLTSLKETTEQMSNVLKEKQNVLSDDVDELTLHWNVASKKLEYRARKKFIGDILEEGFEYRGVNRPFGPYLGEIQIPKYSQLFINNRRSPLIRLVVVGYGNKEANSRAKNRTVVVGGDNYFKSFNTIIGHENRSEHEHNVMLGNNLYSSRSGSILIGRSLYNDRSTQLLAIGTNHGKTQVYTDSDYSIAIGAGTQLNHARQSVVIGSDARSNEANNVVIGTGAYLDVGNSIAIGSFSAVTEADKRDDFGIISIGKSQTEDEEGITRRLINVSKGVNDNDAVNVAQLNEAIENAIGGASGSGAPSVDFERLKNLINEKADRNSVQAALADKADKNSVKTALADKADKSSVKTALADKADKNSMETALDDKADKNAGNIGEHVSSWQDKLGTANNNGDLDEVNSSLAKHSKEITKNSNELKKHDETLGNHKNRLDAHEGALANHEKTLGDHVKTLANHEETLDDHVKTLANHEKTLGSHEEKLAGHEAKLNNVELVEEDGEDKGKIKVTNLADATADSHALNYGQAQREFVSAKTYQSDMKNVNSRLNSLNDRINDLNDDMKRGFARQAALAGLISPHGVGKCNVTAALGGSGSKTAIAIGAGYRPNANIAVRFGIAGNTENASTIDYNVGASFEW